MEEQQQGGLRGLSLMSSQAKSVTVILSGINRQSVWILGGGVSSTPSHLCDPISSSETGC